MIRVVKAESTDWTGLLNNTLSDGTLDLDKPTTNTSTLKRGKPIWRLANHTTSDHDPKPQAAITGIKPAEMMHVALNYGGLPGYAYVNSLQEFCDGVEDEMVAEVVARRCDLLTDRAYSIGQMFKEQVKKQGILDDKLLEECFRIDFDDVLENNELIIRVLSECMVDEPTRDRLVKKLHSQLSTLTPLE